MNTSIYIKYFKTPNIKLLEKANNLNTELLNRKPMTINSIDTKPLKWNIRHVKPLKVYHHILLKNQ